MIYWSATRVPEWGVPGFWKNDLKYIQLNFEITTFDWIKIISAPDLSPKRTAGTFAARIASKSVPVRSNEAQNWLPIRRYPCQWYYFFYRQASRIAAWIRTLKKNMEISVNCDSRYQRPQLSSILFLTDDKKHSLTSSIGRECCHIGRNGICGKRWKR